MPTGTFLGAHYFSDLLGKQGAPRVKVLLGFLFSPRGRDLPVAAAAARAFLGTFFSTSLRPSDASTIGGRASSALPLENQPRVVGAVC